MQILEGRKKANVEEILEAEAGAKILKVRCPYCLEIHQHGLKSGKRLPVWRTPHCEGKRLPEAYLVVHDGPSLTS